MPLPGIYLKDSKSMYHKDIFTSMFIAALFTNSGINLRVQKQKNG